MACADLYGKPSTEKPHTDLVAHEAGQAPHAARHYTCARCDAMFARIQAGPPERQIWMLLNAGQH